LFKRFLFLETGSHYIVQAGLELLILLASVFLVLGLQVCATTPCLGLLLKAMFEKGTLSNEINDSIKRKLTKSQES
jgi:hypothetical protein